MNVLGVAGDVTHEALLLSAELLQFAPMPGLEVAARALLDIWDALQMVDVSEQLALDISRSNIDQSPQVNRLACLRLTERCATILFSVREDIAEAGDKVGEELINPIERLVE